MRQAVSEFYTLSEDDFKALWRDCLFVLDANVLLNVYRYSENRRLEFLDLVTRIRDQVWIPYQAASEYQIGRLKVISEHKKTYQAVKDAIGVMKKGFGGALDQLQLPRHPLLGQSVEALRQHLKSFEENTLAVVKAAEEKHPNLLESDIFRDKLTELLAGRVGARLSDEELQDVRRDADLRNEQQRPPGFRDKDKKESHRYGDAIIWREILNHAKAMKRPIVFVTSDGKDDWWWKLGDRTLGPHFELVREFREQTGGHLFYIYETVKFMEHARERLKVPLADVIQEEKAINESRSVQNYIALATSAKGLVRREFERYLEETAGQQEAIRKAIGEQSHIESAVDEFVRQQDAVRKALGAQSDIQRFVDEFAQQREVLREALGGEFGIERAADEFARQQDAVRKALGGDSGINRALEDAEKMQEALRKLRRDFGGE